jgi:hypothetical protein
MAHAVASDKDDIEPYGHAIIFSMGSEEILSRFYDSIPFSGSEGKLQISDPKGFPRFHFHEDDHIIVEGDYIDLSPLGPYVSGQHHKALAL